MQDATFLFTDIEGSTRLWEEQPERMAAALARHDALVREAVAAHGGRVVKMTGDGVHAAFATAEDAVRAVLRLQAALREAGAELPLRVRAGLHRGVAEGRDGDYFGSTVNRAARLMSAAHGGQVLVSAAVAEAVGDRLPAGAALRDLGIVRLRDLARADRVFQLAGPGMPPEFPPLRSLEDTPNNLPQDVSSFVGRDAERAELARLLDAHRLVTVVGMGGVGKTRLAIHAAADRLDDFRDGVFLVELASIASGANVPHAIAASIGLRLDDGRSAVDALKAHLADRRVLLLMDNCEHLLEPVARLVRELLAASRGLQVLATSREPLRLTGEAISPLAGLRVPSALAIATALDAGEWPAMRLFLERAFAASPGLAQAPVDMESVAAVCHRLDGIPLAIELAAARAGAMTLADIARRLNDRFRFLTARDPTALPRQRTLGALIDWSYELLAAEEAAAFRSAGVFAGGWTLEAAVAVCGPDAADLLERLVGKSLITVDLAAARYGMLETVREYGLGRLTPDEARDARERHLAHYLALAEDARPRLNGPERNAWLARLGVEIDNFLRAHAWALDGAADATAALRLANALKLFWMSRGLLELGLDLVDRALARSPHTPPLLLSQGLFNAGQLRYFMGRHGEARRDLERSLGIARGLGKPYVAAVLQPLGMAALAEGRHDTALACFQEALALARDSGKPLAVAGALNALAMYHRSVGDPAQARPLCEEVVRVARTAGDEEVAAVGTLNLAMVLLELGDGDGARRAAAGAAGQASISAPVAQALLDVCAAFAADAGDATLAGRCYGAAEAQARRSGLRRDAVDAVFLARRLDALRNDAAFTHGFALGREEPSERACEAACRWLAGDREAVATASR